MCIEFGVFLFALRQCVRQIWYLCSGVAHRCKKRFFKFFFYFGHVFFIFEVWEQRQQPPVSTVAKDK